MWPEVESAKADNKRELSITGKAFLEKFKKSGLDPTIFTLFHLNFLNISEIALDILPSEIGNLENLQSLILFGNKLSVLPSEVAKLANLKMLDVSRNELKEFPECLNGLTKLVSINLSNNSIEIVPKWTVTTLKSIDFSNNKLIIFPDICYAEMSQLSEVFYKLNIFDLIVLVILISIMDLQVQLHGNKIEEIPENIMHLSSLKFLDVSSNSIKALPKVLASISKLKGNRIFLNIYLMFVNILILYYYISRDLVTSYYNSPTIVHTEMPAIIFQSFKSLKFHQTYFFHCRF